MCQKIRVAPRLDSGLFLFREAGLGSGLLTRTQDPLWACSASQTHHGHSAAFTRESLSEEMIVPNLDIIPLFPTHQNKNVPF